MGIKFCKRPKYLRNHKCFYTQNKVYLWTNGKQSRWGYEKQTHSGIAPNIKKSVSGQSCFVAKMIVAVQ